MPVYQITTSGVDLSQEQRDTLAQQITRTHHDVTGAPDPFIRVVFTPMPLGVMYTAGRIEPSIILHGACRAGRSDQTRHELLHTLYDVLQKVVDLPPDQVLVAINETESSWLMEGGLELPPPTHEAEVAWMKQLNEIFPGKYAQWT
jgi:phenylpyruvate tautomerase PptA (4-oxalocrotonate tautomerase family)